MSKPIDRAAWLQSMRRESAEKYDDYAHLYGEGKAGLYDNSTHLQYLRAFLDLLPPRAAVLDAACGAGRYLPYLVERGCSVLATDQSQGMLDQARSLFPSVPFEKLDLQEMAYNQQFDGAICMDAMENVPPEEWPLVLSNFHRALRPAGLLYFTAETLELAGESELKAAFEKASQAGLPVVYGEDPEDGVYHFHPSNVQVGQWVDQAGFEILQEGDSQLWYYHLLARKDL